jgi:haloacetate dehalogenase
MFDCLADWQAVSHNAIGRALPCGHFVPEEAPQETLAEIERFLQAHPMGSAA